MSRLDIVIFGATGFTGVKAVEELLRISKKFPEIKWAVAGRSLSKLETLMKDLGKKSGEDLSSIKIIIADVGDEKSLKDMCAQTKLVASCCGPFRLYGEPLVKAAIDSKTHYIDVSGETQFIETMQLEYSEAARNAGVYVISACAFDSIPNDMGVIYMQQNFGGTVNSVESYLSFYIPPEVRKDTSSGIIHYGTWESLIYSLAHSSELGPIRKKLFAEKLPSFKPVLEARPPFYQKGGKRCLPFSGVDRPIVYRTQRYLYETEQTRPAQFRLYIKLPSLLHTVMTAMGVMVIVAMTKTSFTRKLLLRYPKIFSFGTVTKEGPKENVMNNTFFKFDLYGEGWAEGVDVETVPPNKKMAVRVTGVNPGYGATVTALIISAVTILKESDKMPGTGGVFTTGAAFAKTNLIERLHENNIKFEIVEDGQ